MSDMHADRRASAAVSRRLGAEVAVIAERLAALLERLPAPHPQADQDGRRFLWEYSRSASALRPAGETPVHPLDRLIDAARLTRFEVDLLLLAGIPEEHEGLSAIMRELHPRGEPRPTIGLAAQLFVDATDDRVWLRFALESGPLISSGAVIVSGDSPFFEQSIRLADQLWPALHGVDAWPSSIQRQTSAAVVAGLESWFETPEVSDVTEALKTARPVTILVTGVSEDVAAERAAAIVARAGVPYLRVRPESMSPQVEQLISLHAVVRAEVPIVTLRAGEGVAGSHAVLVEHPGPVVLCARTGSGAYRGIRPMLALEVEPLPASARRRMWAAALPELDAEAGVLASRHTVEPSIAAEAASDARAAGDVHGAAPSADGVSRSLQARARLALSSGVKLIRPIATWQQLVLPSDRMQQLHEALGRLRQQSRVLDEWGFLENRPGARGVRMLFAGPPGTGKTLAAEVLAHEIAAHLLIVDISRVVSKWIGETEKNLAEVFDAAERAQAVLLFDEADALFGKRTEVSDAHDRYANLETAYLLARLERFEGLAILSTNLRQNIDAAFIRRLEFVVEFDEPGPDERLELWRCHLPGRAPVGEDVDLARLAALYPVVGGLIRNAAVAAAFRAAAEGTDISLDHFVSAVRREYQKSGRPFPGVPARSHTQLTRE